VGSDILAGIALGLAGAGHCLGMCGGIAIAFRTQTGSSFIMSLGYHCGRLLSYTLLGALLGTAAGAIELASWTIALRFIAGFLLVAMGLHTLELWMGIRHLEALGGVLWECIAPLAKRLLPPRKFHHSVLLGSLWGLMPCGLIYSALAWSASAASDTLTSGGLMLAFGIGTLPAMLGSTLMGVRTQHLLRNVWMRKSMGGLLVVAGLWSLWLTTNHTTHLLGLSQTTGNEQQANAHDH